MTESYYERNKEKIKARQKNNYHNNPAFKKEHKERVKSYKKRKAQERKLQKAQIKLERKVWRKVRIDNVITECCKIAFLASAIGRGTKRIREWESAGFFPKTIKIKGLRYYTKKHFNLVTMQWSRCGNGKNLKEFFQKINENWNKCYPENQEQEKEQTNERESYEQV